VTLLKAVALMAPLMLPQVSFSLAVAWLLHRQRRWLDRPLPLLGAAVAVIPLYLLAATPAVVAWACGRVASPGRTTPGPWPIGRPSTSGSMR
jgi:hypothetical protein